MQRNQEAVRLTPIDHPNRPQHLQSLAVCLGDRYQRLGDLEDLEAALKMEQEAVDLTPSEHPERAARLRSLAISFTERYQRSGNMSDLEAALQRKKEVIDLTALDHPDRARSLRSLALSLLDHFRRLGDLEDLETAMQKLQEAVDLTPTDHPLKAECLQGLAVSFNERYRWLGELKDLEESLQKNQEVVQITPANHVDRSGHLQNLGICFHDRYQRLGDLKDLETAVHTFQEALNLTPADHPQKAQYLRSLSASFGDRYHRLGDLKDLDAAMHRLQEAVELIPIDHSDRARYLNSLAQALQFRYERLGDPKDLERALQNNQDAVDITPADHPDMARHLSGLALSFNYRYRRLGNLKDLEAALQTNQQAVDITPAGHPNRPGYLRSLAACFTDKYERVGAVGDLQTALQRKQEAVKLTPEDHLHKAGHLQSLALSFADQYKRTWDLNDLEAVHTHYMMSFSMPSLTPEPSWRAALRWASFADIYQRSYSPKAYTAAFDLLPEILWISQTVPVRQDAVHRLDIERTTSTATSICIKLSNLTTAVEIVERGLATTFQQMLQLKPDLAKLPPQQAEELQRLSSELYIGTSPNLMDLANQRKDLLANIRKQPGLEDFLHPKSYSVLCEASRAGPVVILNSHEDACDGIIILNPTSEPVHVSLPRITLEELQAQRDMLKKYLDRSSLRTCGESVSTRLFGQREGFQYESMNEYLEEMLTWLWTNIVDPVYQTLASHGIYKGRLWWLPTGAFTGLPLHASPPLDQFIHSYTATLGSLLEAYNQKTSSALKVGVVGVTHTGPGGRNHLKGVKQEVQNIRSVVGSPNLECLEGEHATPEAVKHQLQNCSWLHLACHGRQDSFQPTKSCPLLYDGTLELETILQMPISNAEFVFLAACQTAMGNAELVNESFHLGGGFIAAGFRSAVGTLWSINDQDGPQVAEVFYGHLFRDRSQPQASDTAEALHLAVKELKARKVAYERWVPFIHMGV
ncbi:CHAT domain-containing protein [Mycena rosella]|uniref:CHAT domain-containing protein n=1 Tax=Mycena rosella TaxID=1033263 RepID=A0AAD7DBQ1_MYCRO|nr:CHAT domain-containing protein [Mycena rosella]